MNKKKKITLYDYLLLYLEQNKGIFMILLVFFRLSEGYKTTKCKMQRLDKVTVTTSAVTESKSCLGRTGEALAWLEEPQHDHWLCAPTLPTM